MRSVLSCVATAMLVYHVVCHSSQKVWADEAAAVAIDVDAKTVLHPVSKYLTGACIEDVNHEIYGGIYSQMIFGESFQEPVSAEPKGFRSYGGKWQVRGNELHAHGSAGDKLVSDLPAFRDGEVGVEVFIADQQQFNAGLIVRVAKPGRGMDNFDGYEISLNASRQHVLLGRHRHNWERIQEFPCVIPIGKWSALAVKLDGRAIEISVNGKTAGRYEDSEHELAMGSIGLRKFQPETHFRGLWVKTNGQTHSLPFETSVDPQQEVSGIWKSIQSGTAKGSYQIEPNGLFAGRPSQQMTFTEGQGAIGVENRGLNRWGLFIEGGKSYEGLVWVRSNTDTPLFASIENADGSRVLAETKLSVRSGDWQSIPFKLTPSATAHQGRFTMSLREKGSVLLGYAFLQPGDWGRFKGLPSRKDVVEGLIKQGVTVLRYGGSMVNNNEYRWKRMIGPRDKRPPYAGFWYPQSTNGWGIIDFLATCEAAGFLSIPAFNMGESASDMADFVEYVNGPASSEWGRKRAEDGNPAPFHLKYIQLGNEERIDDEYVDKFKPMAEAIWQKDPNIVIVVGDFVYGEKISDPFNFKRAASRITTLAAHQQILKLAKQHGREVWFDVHVGTDGPRPDSTLDATISYIDALEKISDGANFKVVVFEFNSGNHSQRRALANSLALNSLERDGRVPVICSANCLQPDGQNDNDWDQGLLFLNPSQVWLQPPGYVCQMYSRNHLPNLVSCKVTGGDQGLDANAKCSADGRSLVLQVVNPTDRQITTQIRLHEFSPHRAQAEVTELVGPLGVTNVASVPQRIVPRVHQWDHGANDKTPQFTIAPYSVTFIRFE